MVQIINSCQSWPTLQWLPSSKHQLATANNRPGKADTLSQHAKAKSDDPSHNARCRQAIPTCIASHCIQGAANGQNSGQADMVK